MHICTGICIHTDILIVWIPRIRIIIRVSIWVCGIFIVTAILPGVVMNSTIMISISVVVVDLTIGFASASNFLQFLSESTLKIITFSNQHLKLMFESVILFD